MDLQTLIESKRQKLKPCKTVVTDALGRRYQVTEGTKVELSQGLPFVVDNKPDLQVAVIRPGLFLSSQDPALSIDILKQNNIQHILSVGIEPSVKFENVQYHYCDLLDLPEADVHTPILTCMIIIQQFRQNNILVHCNAGVSRSPMIVISYLMITENLSYIKACEEVKQKRPCIRLNDGFARRLKSLNVSNYLL